MRTRKSKFWAIVRAKSKRKKRARKYSRIKLHKYDGRYHNKGHFDYLTWLRLNGR